MLHAPTSETKTEAAQSKSQLVLQHERELHPHSFGASEAYALNGVGSVASPRSPEAQQRQTMTGMQSTHGNQAVLRMLHSPQRVARIPTLRPSQSIMLQRKCACGGSSESAGECAECKAKREGALQRRVANQGASPSATNSVPPIVHDVLRSPGQPLDAGSRAFMEPRFGHDFSQVRVHTDAKAAESARTVNALAYTVGQDVVLGSGQYSPQTSRGRWLLAHELAHTIQQGTSQHFLGAEDTTSEHSADLAASSVVLNQRVKVAPVATSPAIQFKKAFEFGGSFDKVLERFDKLHPETPINKDALRLLKRSPAFMSIVSILNRHYESFDYSIGKEHDDKGNYPNGKRVLMLEHDGGARFVPYGAPDNRLPGDLIYVDDVSDLIAFIHDISHEATHAASMFEKVSQPTDLQGAIDSFIKNEIETRKSTEKIARGIPDPNVRKEAIERAARESTHPAEVERDFSPGIGLTYLEAAVFEKQLSDALIADQLTVDKAFDIRETVDKAMQAKAEKVPWIPKQHPVRLEGVSIPLPSEYAYVWFERQKAKREWEEFEEKHKMLSPDAKEDAKEELLKKHLERLNKKMSDKPVSYSPSP